MLDKKPTCCLNIHYFHHINNFFAVPGSIETKGAAFGAAISITMVTLLPHAIS